MIIKRIINDIDVEIKLTADELYQTCYEQRDLFDINDVVEYLESRMDNEAFYSNYKIVPEDILKDESLVADIAAEVRRQKDKYNSDFDMAIEEALNICDLLKTEDVNENEYDFAPTSCSSRDYGPSNPWDAPGMSKSDFI